MVDTTMNFLPPFIPMLLQLRPTWPPLILQGWRWDHTLGWFPFFHR